MRRLTIISTIALLLLLPVVALAQDGDGPLVGEVNVFLDLILGAITSGIMALVALIVGKATGYRDKLSEAAKKGEDALKAAENKFFEAIADFKPIFIAAIALIAPWLSAKIGVPIDADSLANAPLIVGSAITIRELVNRFVRPLLGKLPW